MKRDDPYLRYAAQNPYVAALIVGGGAYLFASGVATAIILVEPDHSQELAAWIFVFCGSILVFSLMLAAAFKWLSRSRPTGGPPPPGGQ